MAYLKYFVVCFVLLHILPEKREAIPLSLSSCQCKHDGCGAGEIERHTVLCYTGAYCCKTNNPSPFPIQF